MSSYDIEHAPYLVFVGWDRPLDTFFATIERTDNVGMEEPEMLLGTEPGAYRDLAGFQQALGTALKQRGIMDFTIESDLLAQLQQDYDESPPGTGQQAKTPEIQAFNQLWLHGKGSIRDG